MRLMIVGTLSGQLTLATKIAMERGAKVTHVEDTEQALRVLRAGRGADLLMVDVGQPIGSLVRQLAAERICVPIVACGIDNDAKAAVAAIHAGAKEYIPLPPDPELIAAVLAAVAEDNRDLVFKDEAMKHVVDLAAQIAKSDASVLITGESGTGKEVVARYLHQRSNGAGRAFISVNCAAMPEQLLESELFGHEKGSFTGAVARRVAIHDERHATAGEAGNLILRRLEIALTTGRARARPRPSPAPGTTPMPRLIRSCSSSLCDDDASAVSSVIRRL